MDLPAEIRSLIYGFALGGRVVSLVYDYSDLGHGTETSRLHYYDADDADNFKWAPLGDKFILESWRYKDQYGNIRFKCPAGVEIDDREQCQCSNPSVWELLCVSRQIYSEALPVFYVSNKFSFSSVGLFFSFIDKVTGRVVLDEGDASTHPLSLIRSMKMGIDVNENITAAMEIIRYDMPRLEELCLQVENTSLLFPRPPLFHRDFFGNIEDREFCWMKSPDYDAFLKDICRLFGRYRTLHVGLGFRRDVGFIILGHFMGDELLKLKMKGEDDRRWTACSAVLKQICQRGSTALQEKLRSELLGEHGGPVDHIRAKIFGLVDEWLVNEEASRNTEVWDVYEEAGEAPDNEREDAGDDEGASNGEGEEEENAGAGSSEEVEG